MLNKQYNLKVKQNISEIFNNIENSYIKNNIDLTSGLILENNVLVKDSLLSENDRVFICSDICASYNIEKSNEDFSVPDTKDYYFLNKIGGEYNFIKDRPLPNNYLDDNELLSFNGLSYSVLINTENYKNCIQTSIETLLQSSNLNDSYRCFSFNFGGISKTSSIFYTLDSNNILQLINPTDVNVLIDYVEGNLYLKRTEVTDSFVMVIGLFNIDPIIISKKGNLKLTETSSSFYKFLNNADKGNINIKSLDNKYILTSVDNMYIYTTTENFVVDGIQLQANYKLYVPKNTSIVLEFKYDTPVISDYVSNITSVVDSSANFDSITNSSYLNENNITIYPSNYGSIFIAREIEKNTYNFERPSILSLKNNIE